MKKAVFLIVFMILVSSISACSTGRQKNIAVNKDTPAVSDEKKEPVKLRFFITDPTDKQQIDNGLSEFVKEYPNIQVETIAVTGNNALQQINTAILGGEQIDVLYSSYAYFLGTAPKMYLPLNDLINKDGSFDIMKDFGNYIDYATVDGVIYGLPKELAPAGILYNSAQFKEAGLAEPTPDWTWADFFDLANKLKVIEGNIVKRYGAFDWDPLMGYVNSALYSGWEIMTAEGKPNFTDPRFRQMLELYRNAMVVNKSMPSPAETIINKYSFAVDMFKGKWSLLITGRNIALFLDKHRYLLGTLPADLDDANTFKMAYMPKWDVYSKAKAAYDIPILLAISKNTKYVAESFELLKWTCTKLYELSAKTTPQVPAYRKANMARLIDGWTYYQNNNGKFVKGRDRTEMYNILLDPEIFAIVPKNTLKYPISAQFYDIAQKYGSLVLNGQMDIDTAIKGMQKEAEDALTMSNK